MNVLCVMHADFEKPGAIESWAKEQQLNWNCIRPYAGDAFPEIADVDCCISMGGPQRSLEVGEYAYLLEEVAFLESMLAENKPVIGFCLGSQLIGMALGAPPEKSPQREVGVWPISLPLNAASDPLLRNLGESLDVIHWHSDMPGLTKETEILAFSEGCPRQIVKYKDSVYGFQCHMEIDGDGIEGMIENASNDLVPGRFVMSCEDLRRQDYDSINRTMFTILDRWLETSTNL